MKNKRFVFTIKKDLENFLEDEAKFYGTSQSKTLNKLIAKYKDAKNDLDLSDEKGHTNQLVEIIKSHMYCQEYEVVLNIFLTTDYIVLAKNIDADLAIYIIRELIRKYPDEDNLLLIYSKFLKHKGLYEESINTLMMINDKEKFYKYLLLAQINIARGKIEEARICIINAQVGLNLKTLSPDYKRRNEDLTITKAEFIWIDEGVSAAIKYITPHTEHCSPRFKGIGFALLGEFLRDKGEYIKAENYYIKSIYILKDVYEYGYIIRSFKGLGSIYKNKGDLIKASKYIFHALELGRDYKDALILGNVLGSTGSLYQSKGELQLADIAYEEKKSIGIKMVSLRESFYANYDLCLSSIEQGNLTKGRLLIEENENDGKQFKRDYYSNIWKGYIDSFDNTKQGIDMVRNSKRHAIETHEDKRINIAEYVEGAIYYKDHSFNSVGEKMLTNLLKKEDLSDQIRKGIGAIFNGSKYIKSV